MSNETKSGYWWFLWLCVAVIGLAALMVFSLSSKSTTPTTRRVTITMATNGTARLGGVPLPTATIRDAAFSALGSVGVKAQLTVPAKTPYSNVIETLKSMTRAGLFTTNQPPNPYE